MSCTKILTTLLLISIIWSVEGIWKSNGFKRKGAAQISCGLRDIYLKNNRYYCYTITETILNEYEKLFGTDKRNMINNDESFQNLIKKIEDNSFCQAEPNELLLILFPDYEQYVALGKVINKFRHLVNYCDEKAIQRGGKLTAEKLEKEIQKRLDDGICEQITKDASRESSSPESKRLQEIGRVLKNNKYCVSKIETFGKKVCSYIFSAWLVCGVARVLGADV